MQTRLLLAFALIIASAGAWMDPAWQYRTPVTVSNGGSALADYQVSVTLNTNALILAGKMRSDCGDLRFANSTDNSLPFWVETGTCNTASTKAWVRLPYIPGGSSMIYAYYGNAAAAGASSGTATFPFFDDFNRPNGIVGNGWTEYHSGGNAVYAIVSNVLHVTDSTGFNEWISKPATLPSDFSLEMNVLSFPSPSNDAEIITGVGGTLFNWLSLDNYPQGSNTRINGVYQNLGGLTTGRWKITKIGTTWRFYNGLDQNRGSYTINIGTATTIYIASFGSSESFDIDDFRVRNYASTEPTTSPQAEQARPTVIFAGISPASVASYPNTPQGFALWIYSNQTSADSIALSCTGTCYYSENPVAVSAQQNKSVTVTVPTASVSGTTNYQITAVSQANALNNATASFSITVDATTWRSKWTDAFNNTYAYRAPITISNNGSALTDYQVPVNLANLIYNNTGLVGSWHFSESAGTRFADSSGNGNDGTYNGETFNTGTLNNFNLTQGSGWTPGRYGNALQLDGVNDYVDAGNATPLSIRGPLTLSVWVRSTASISQQGVFGKWGATAATDSYLLQVINNKPRFALSDGTTQPIVNAVSSINDGNWHHLAGVYNGTNMSIYVDGIKEGDAAGPSTIGANAIPLEMGRNNQNSLYSFNGTLDDIRVYNRSLSASEIAQVYQNNTFLRSGLVGYWRFDEGAGTTAQDTHHIATQDNRDGTKFGNALSFDGANDYAAVASSASLNPGKFTVAAWIKTVSPADSFIVDKWGSDTGYALWILGSKITLTVNYYLNRVSGNTTVTDGAWHYAVATHDGQTMRIYVDGNLDGTLALAQDAVSTAFDLNLGRYRQSNAYYFNGTIDEVRIYNRALSPQEIATLYGAGKLKLDYSDLRFANSSISSIPYWLESDNRAWAKVPYVPNGTSTIYAYYGSPTAQSAANGNATFDFFDDFEDGTYAGKWSNTYGTLAETGGYLDYIGLNGYWTSARANYAVPSTSWVMETSASVTAQSSTEYATVGQTGPDNSGASRPGPQVGVGQLYGLTNFYLETATATGVYTDTPAGALGYNTWYASPRIIELRKTSGNAQAKVYDGNRNQLASATSTTNVPDSTNPFGIYAAAEGSGLHTRLYWFLVRKYASPEPAGALLLEEPANPAAILSILPSGKTTYPSYNETFTLWVYNNQTGSDTFALSCAGTCSVSPAYLPLASYQNGSANVTITSANVSGTTNYVIMATSQSNASNSAGIFASITVDTTRWRSNWTDAYGNGFRYRVPITLNNTGGALSDYQINITIDTSTPVGLARMRGDCGDLRITNGTNEMPYWIESGCNSPSTKIWARVPYVPTGNSTVYAYYGSSAAANASNGTATFEFFDDFEDGTLGKWATPGAATIVTSPVHSGAKAILANNAAATISKKWGVAGNKYALDFWMYDGGQSARSEVWGGLGNSAGASWRFLIAARYDNTYWTYVAYPSSYVNTPFARNRYAYSKVTIIYDGGSSIKYTVNDGALQQVANSWSDGVDNIWTGLGWGGQSEYLDDFRVRKYSSPEPSALAGAEQSKGYRTLVRRCGLVQPNATVTAYQANASIGSCVSNTYGICALEIGAGIYDLQFTFVDSSTAWKYGTVFS